MGPGLELSEIRLAKSGGLELVSLTRQKVPGTSVNCVRKALCAQGITLYTDRLWKSLFPFLVVYLE